MKYSTMKQRAWYARQKSNTGIVYRVICKTTGECYVGSTTNSLKKRFNQMKASPNKLVKEAMERYGKHDFYIEELEKVTTKCDLKSVEQKWIDILNPEFNINSTKVYTKPTKVVKYKDGVWVLGVFYPTKLAAWQAVGVIPYGTMKSRFFRTKDIEFSLGLKPYPDNDLE